MCPFQEDKGDFFLVEELGTGPDLYTFMSKHYRPGGVPISERDISVIMRQCLKVAVSRSQPHCEEATCIKRVTSTRDVFEYISVSHSCRFSTPTPPLTDVRAGKKKTIN